MRLNLQSGYNSEATGREFPGRRLSAVVAYALPLLFWSAGATACAATNASSAVRKMTSKVVLRKR